MSEGLHDYWVCFAGEFADADFDYADPAVKQFLNSLLACLRANTDARSPLVISNSNARVTLAGVVRAATEGGAVDSARAVFTEAITCAGGTSQMPGNGDPAWYVERLLREVKLVRELQAAA
jgi:hypothetical protein